MLTDLFSGAGRNSHWVIVVLVAAAFLLVQLALSLRVYVRTRSHNRLLVRMCREIERGGGGRRHPDDIPWGFGWLHWVLSVFPDDSPAGAPPPFSRDEVLHELDTRIASESSYLLLQRMGIMAPLLGVVLTVLGFYWLDIDGTGEQSLQTILVAVTPLVAGVGAGAILALVNQGLLQVVGARLEALRMTARSWFDASIWRHISAASRSTSRKTGAAFERLAAELATSAERQAASAGRLEAATTSIQRAASQFETVVHAFQGEIKGIPQALATLRDATSASAHALEELLPVGARAVANLDVSVAAFRTTVDREFTDAARLHLQASKAMATSVDHIGASTDALRTSAQDMQAASSASAASIQRADEALSSAAQGLGGSGDRLRHAIESQMAPAQHSLHEAASSFARSAQHLAHFIDAGLQPAAADLAALHDTLTSLRAVVESINRLSHTRPNIDQLTETLARSSEIADALSALPEQMRDALEGAAVHTAGLSHSPTRMPWRLKRPR